MKTLKEKIDVMQAALDGKEIEFIPADTCCEWHVLTRNAPSWNWSEYDYRIKYEPMEFYITLNMNGELKACDVAAIAAEDSLRSIGSGSIIKVREVIE